MAYERQHLIVKIIGVFCVISFALVVLLLLVHWCGPVEGYWDLPVKNSRSFRIRPDCTSGLTVSRGVCDVLQAHYLCNGLQHLDRPDAAGHPHPHCDPKPDPDEEEDCVVLRAGPRVSQRKDFLPPCCPPPLLDKCLQLGLQILVAILNRYFNFSNPNSMFYMYWYVAEMATAVYVGNVPLCWQLIAHVFSMGSWASFGSASDRAQVPPPRAADNNLDPKKPKRFIRSMLPASLWSTQDESLAGTTRVTTRGADSRAGGRRIGTLKTASEEAIVWSEPVPEEDSRTDMELSSMDRKGDRGRLSADEAASSRRRGD